MVGILTNLDLPSDLVSDRIATVGEGRVCTFPLQYFHRIVHGGG
jgi:hypothetical protein